MNKEIRIIKSGDGHSHLTKKEIGETYKAARKIKGVYDFTFFKRKKK